MAGHYSDSRGIEHAARLGRVFGCSPNRYDLCVTSIPSEGTAETFAGRRVDDCKEGVDKEDAA
jgi:hypothetical protein